VPSSLDETSALRAEGERYPWYHTLELADVTFVGRLARYH
jgi:hypothetical protein